MEDKHKMVLNRNTAEFTKSLIPDDILPYLISKRIISSDDVQRLECSTTTTMKVVHLIFTLQRKGPEAFKYFLEALKEHPFYGHLVSKINDCLNEYEKVEDEARDKWQWSPMSKYQSAALDHCNQALNLGLPFEAVCKYFLNVGFLEKGDIAFMEKLPEQSSQRSILLAYVKGRGKVAYELLVDFMHEECPRLEKEILKAEKEMEKKVEQFHRLVTFAFKYKKVEDYSKVPRQLNIILIGKTGSGKSATGNRLVGKQNVFLEVPGSASGTKTVQKETTYVHGLEINILDTPGLFDTTISLGNEDIILEIMKTTQEFSQGVHLFLFVCRGTARFTKEEMETFNKIEKYFSADVLRHCLLVMTCSDEAVGETSFQEYLKKNSKLHTLYGKTGEKAIAVENKDQTSALIDSDMKRKQLVHAIVDVVNCNDGKTFSSSIFEATQRELECEQNRLNVLAKINDLTFQFLIYNFTIKPLSALSVEHGISNSDIDMIISKLRIDERSLRSNEDMERMIRFFFKDCIEFVESLIKSRMKDQKLLEKIKAEHPNETFPDSIITYVLQCFETLSEETSHKLKAGENLPKHEIHRIVNESPFTKSSLTQPDQISIIQQYINMIVNAFKRQNQRRQLIRDIHSNCRDVIKTYFRMKSYKERNNVIYRFIKNGYMPPDLHCLCLQTVSKDFKSLPSWDSTIEGILFQTLIDRVNTESSTLQSIIKILTDSGDVILSVIKSLFPSSVTIAVLVGVGAAAAALKETLMENVFKLTMHLILSGLWSTSDDKMVTCNECNSRHRDKRFKPKEKNLLKD